MGRPKTLRLALAGNPNVGKSTLFNALTGASQHTGNWPGKTVERASGRFEAQGRTFDVVDLPGTYSLAAQSPEEVIARDYIIERNPDVIVNLVDATNLERNLNLTLQVLELTGQVVVALNFMDEIERGGWEIDVKMLSAGLGVPVVPIVATRREGLEDLLAAIVAVADRRQETAPVSVDYGVQVEKCVAALEADLLRTGITDRRRYLALKLLEDDPEIARAFGQGVLPAFYGRAAEDKGPAPAEGLQKVLQRAVRLREATKPDAKVEIVRRRFELAHDIVHRAVRRVVPQKDTLTERLDRIVTHKVWAWPIMIAALGGMVWLTVVGAGVAEPWLSGRLSWLVELTRQGLAYVSAPPWAKALLVDGVLFGTAAVIAVMLPPMLILFTIFNAFEDAGFIPRIAFNLDRVMRAAGSQGKHVLVLAMSLGCNVTGVLSSRVIENEKDRLLAIITNPLVLCSGRFGAATALAILFFGNRSVAVLLSLALLSLATTLLATFLLSRTILQGEPRGFVMELPPYRVPQWRIIMRRTLIDQVGHVLLRAVLFAAPAAAIIWALGNLPVGRPFEETPIRTLVGWLDPAGRPLGLTGEMVTALLFALPAKEIIVPSLAMTHGVQSTLAETSESVLAGLAQDYSPLVSYAFMVFFLLYLPCLVTVWAAWKETRSIKWVAMSLLVPLVTATLLTFLIYQGGRLLGLA